MKFRLSYFFLHIFCFSLALSEAIKNISWVLFIISWLLENHQRFNKKDIFSDRNIQINTLFLFTISLPLIVAYFCKFKMDEWDGCWDVIRYGFVWFALCHSSFCNSDNLKLLISFTVSTILTSIYGLYEYYDTGARHIELNSVGHVNHSAIYLGLIICILITQLFFINKKNLYISLLLISSLLFLVYIFFEMGARGAFIPVLLYTIIAILLNSNSRIYKVLFISITALILYISYLNSSELSKKFLSKSNGLRPQIFNTSLVFFKYSPNWGIGLENSKYFYNYKKFNEICKELDVDIINELYIPKGSNVYHAHNLYMQSLVERGAWGSIPLVVLGLFWLKNLIQDFGQSKNEHLRLFWGCSLAAFLMVFVGGIFNTTLHHEHGTLCLILFAFHYSTFKKLKDVKESR